jgi:hypothetical protein
MSPLTSRMRPGDSVVPPSEWDWLENTQGLIDPVEGDWLARQAWECPADKVIVEVGSHTGLSTLWLAAGSMQGNRAKVWAIDPWPDPGYAENDDPFDLKTGDAVYHRFWSNIQGQTQELPNTDYSDVVRALRMTSQTAARLWKEQRIYLLFIDAIHTFEGVKADVELWSKFVVPGGWMALNDYYQDPERTQLHGAALVAKEILEPSGQWYEYCVVWNTWVGRKR